jgi:hypothetical protein
MATEFQLEQSSAEDVTYPLDFLPQLLDGVSLTGNGAVVTHVPPGIGTPVTVTPSLLDDVVYVPIPADLDEGVHEFSCVAITTNAAVKPEILLIVTVMR